MKQVTSNYYVSMNHSQLILNYIGNNTDLSTTNSDISYDF